MPDSGGVVQERGSDSFSGETSLSPKCYKIILHHAPMIIASGNSPAIFRIGKNQYQTSADDPEVGSSSMGGAADPFTG